MLSIKAKPLHQKLACEETSTRYSKKGYLLHVPLPLIIMIFKTDIFLIDAFSFKDMNRENILSNPVLNIFSLKSLHMKTVRSLIGYVNFLKL